MQSNVNLSYSIHLYLFCEEFHVSGGCSLLALFALVWETEFSRFLNDDRRACELLYLCESSREHGEAKAGEPEG